MVTLDQRIKALEDALVDILVHDGKDPNGVATHEALREQGDALERGRRVLQGAK